MKLKTLLSFLEFCSFILWMIFTILSIALAGLGLEGIIFAAFLVLVSSTEPVHFPVTMTLAGIVGIFLSIFWRQVGVDHFHYWLYDSPKFSKEDSDAPSAVLESLIDEVESCSGYARNDARAKAKQWLINHVSSLDEEDILLAKNRFGYLLPADWGRAKKR
jgi:hypothetical protein